jgi:hypothetical protein
MVYIKYKLVAVDVANLDFYKEFTDQLEMKEWIREQEATGRDMDWMTYSEWVWLEKQSKPKEKKPIKKYIKKTL